MTRRRAIRLVASLHNTSVAMIEKHYSKYITEHSIDDIARIGLLSEPEPAADNVVPLVGEKIGPTPSCSELRNDFDRLGGEMPRA